MVGPPRDPRRPLRRARGHRQPGVLFGVAAGGVHHRHGDPGGWGAAAVSVLARRGQPGCAAVPKAVVNLSINVSLDAAAAAAFAAQA
jgi:hypothetical protein